MGTFILWNCSYLFQYKAIKCSYYLFQGWLSCMFLSNGCLLSQNFTHQSLHAWYALAFHHPMLHNSRQGELYLHPPQLIRQLQLPEKVLSLDILHWATRETKATKPRVWVDQIAKGPGFYVCLNQLQAKKTRYMRRHICFTTAGKLACTVE